MKNLAIATISIALLWGLSGCVYHDGHYVSGYYSGHYPSAHHYSGVTVYDYPWFYPFDSYSFSYGYNDSYRHSAYTVKIYRHRSDHQISHKRGIYKQHDSHRTLDRHLKRNKHSRDTRHVRQGDNPRKDRQSFRKGTHHRRNGRDPLTLQRANSPRQVLQQTINSRKDNHRQRGNTVVRSERRSSGKRDFNRGSRGNGRRVRCSGRRC